MKKVYVFVDKKNCFCVKMDKKKRKINRTVKKSHMGNKYYDEGRMFYLMNCFHSSQDWLWGGRVQLWPDHPGTGFHQVCQGAGGVRGDPWSPEHNPMKNHGKLTPKDVRDLQLIQTTFATLRSGLINMSDIFK